MGDPLDRPEIDKHVSPECGDNVTLTGDFSRTSLRYRDLRGVDLSGASGLQAWSLAGCDLRGAKLPKDLNFDLLQRIENAAKYGKTNFLILLAAAFVCWLVRISTSDAEMTLASAQADLPLMDIGINITYFYVLSPLLIVTMYVFIHLGLQQMWESIANLPMYFPDGLRIDKKIYPWALVRVSELVFPSLWKVASPRSKRRVLLTFILFWIAVPASLIAYWLHYLQQHELIISVWHVLLIIGTLSLDICFAGRFVTLLIHSRKEVVEGFNDHLQVPRLLADTDTLRSKWLRIRKRSVVVTVGIGTLTALYTVAVICWQFHWPLCLTTVNVQNCTLHRAMLDSKDLDGLDAREACLRQASLERACLRQAHLDGAVLTGTNLLLADLRGAQDLTVEQLLEVKTLHQAKLDPELEEKVRALKPELFEKPE